MKTVFSNREIPHIWATQSRGDEVRGAGSIRARGAFLFSYREVIGVIDGNRAIISSYSWSVTTAKHQRQASQATNHKARVYLPVVFPDTCGHDTTASYLAALASVCKATAQENLVTLAKMCASARTINQKIRKRVSDIEACLNFAGEPVPALSTLADVKLWANGALVQSETERAVNFINSTLDQANSTLAQLKDGYLQNNAVTRLRHLANGMPGAPISAGPFISSYGRAMADLQKHGISFPANTLALPAIVSECETLQVKMENAQQKRITKKYAEQIASWRAGSDPLLPRDLPPMLRLASGNVETSWGAKVPVTVCPSLWAMVNDARKAKTNKHYDNVPVGMYSLNTITAKGDLIIGCHRIPYSEVRAIAKQLNYI